LLRSLNGSDADDAVNALAAVAITIFMMYFELRSEWQTPQDTKRGF
jgi:hypothetical protein